MSKAPIRVEVSPFTINNKMYLEIPDEVARKITNMNGLGIDFPWEMFDVLDIFIMGAEKHGANSYLEPGVFTVKRVNSIIRHNLKKLGIWGKIDPKLPNVEFLSQEGQNQLKLASLINNFMTEINQGSLLDSDKLDEESGLSHDLHSMCNSLMFYILDKRKIGRDS